MKLKNIVEKIKLDFALWKSPIPEIYIPIEEIQIPITIETCKLRATWHPELSGETECFLKLAKNGIRGI